MAHATFDIIGNDIAITMMLISNAFDHDERMRCLYKEFREYIINKRSSIHSKVTAWEGVEIYGNIGNWK